MANMLVTVSDTDTEAYIPIFSWFRLKERFFMGTICEEVS
jgi:hypothetical protein